MPVAAQREMPFTQVLAQRESCPSRQELLVGTAACGWAQCFCTVEKGWMGSGFILSVSLTLRKKICVRFLLLQIPVQKSVEDGDRASSMDAHLFEGAAEAQRLRRKIQSKHLSVVRKLEFGPTRYYVKQLHMGKGLVTSLAVLCSWHGSHEVMKIMLNAFL